MSPGSKWTERKFWIAIATIILIFLTDIMGYNLDVESILGMVGTVLGWLGIEAKMDLEKMRINGG